MSSPAPAKIISRSGNRITLQLDIELTGSLLNMEESILGGCNQLGCLATGEALRRFDSDGSPISIGSTKLTSRTQSKKTYHSPFGKVEIKRHVYQTSKGGKVYCPLEAAARIIQNATPRMAKMLSSKYARLNANETRHDLEDNHGCKISNCYLQQVTDQVGAIAQAKEELWDYATPRLDDDVKIISMSLDGAMVPMRDGDWREAMVGSLSLYDAEGERLHSIYLGASPEYGKHEFKKKFVEEACRITAAYPDAERIGIADGAPMNWSILEPLVQHTILDFYHASEYLAEAAYGAHSEKTGKPKRQAWLTQQCHTLKHEENGAQKVLKELKRVSRKKLTEETKEKVTSAVRYFSNHLSMMNYAEYRERCFPIGSGVTEAACKSLIKQRFCRSGMRWKDKGIKTVLSLRSLVLTPDRWRQFWEKVNQYGIGARI
jgi:hypothetical protein